MSGPDSTLTLRYTRPDLALENPYWLRLVQEDIPDDVATIQATARLLDSLYQVDPCIEAEQEPEMLEQEGYAEAVAEAFDFALCDQAPDGSVDVQLRVIRSHQGEPYHLAVEGGETIESIVVQAETVARGPVSSRLVLDYPVISGFTCQPAPLNRTGNSLSFADQHTGLTYTARYLTRYDLVRIKIFGNEDNQPSECRVLAFYHGTVEDLDLQAPEPEDIDRSLCPSTSWDLGGEPDNVTCVELVTVSTRCTCSQTVVGSRVVEQVVPCPQEMRCSNNDTSCTHVVGTRTVIERVDCPGDRSGDFQDDISSREFYEAACCVWPPERGLPQCVRHTSTLPGNQPIVNGAAFYRGLYGPATRIVPLSPSGGVCGTHTVEQRLAYRNCCDDVEPIAWDEENSADVIADHSYGWFAVIGGRSPFTISVHGQGFFTDHHRTRKTGTTTNRVFPIYTANACGIARITITDGCTTRSITAMSTNGEWVRRNDLETAWSSAPIYLGEADYMHKPPGQNYWYAVKQVGTVKWEQGVRADYFQLPERPLEDGCPPLLVSYSRSLLPITECLAPNGPVAISYSMAHVGIEIVEEVPCSFIQSGNVLYVTRCIVHGGKKYMVGLTAWEWQC